jgi:hypothetical protein
VIPGIQLLPHFLNRYDHVKCEVPKTWLMLLQTFLPSCNHPFRCFLDLVRSHHRYSLLLRPSCDKIIPSSLRPCPPTPSNNTPKQYSVQHSNRKPRPAWPSPALSTPTR